MKWSSILESNSKLIDQRHLTHTQNNYFILSFKYQKVSQKENYTKKYQQKDMLREKPISTKLIK